MSPLLSAIVLNYRSPKDVITCTAALLNQTIAEKMEIVIVDNHSGDESMGWIRSRFQNERKVRIIEERNNLGYGRANNDGVTKAASQYLLIINPDNTLPPAAAEQMLTYLQAHTDVGIVGPALTYPDGSVRPSARPFPSIRDLLRKRFFPKKWQAEFNTLQTAMRSKNAVDIDWMVGACVMIRRDLFLKLGGFDPRFFLFFEDIDLCRRIHAEKLRVVYLPQIEVPDRKKRLSGTSVLSLLSKKTTWIHLSSAMKYFWKWRSQ